MREPREPFDEHKVMARLRVRCALGAWLVGAVAGYVRAAYGEAVLPLPLHALVGLVFLILGGGVGGFVGLLVRSVLHFVLSRDAPAPAEDIVGGMTLGSFVGGFLGLLGSLLLWDWGRADVGAAVGAAVGAMLGVSAGNAMAMLLKMLALEQRENSGPAGKDRRRRR